MNRRISDDVLVLLCYLIIAALIWCGMELSYRLGVMTERCCR